MSSSWNSAAAEAQLTTTSDLSIYDVVVTLRFDCIRLSLSLPHCVRRHLPYD